MHALPTVLRARVALDAAQVDDALATALRVPQTSLIDDFVEREISELGAAGRLERLTAGLHDSLVAQLGEHLGLATPARPAAPSTLMYGNGATFHVDSWFRRHIFVMTFLRVSTGVCLRFPELGLDIALRRGECVAFDPLLVHGLHAARGRASFVAVHTAALLDRAQANRLKLRPSRPQHTCDRARVRIDPRTGRLEHARPDPRELSAVTA